MHTWSLLQYHRHKREFKIALHALSNPPTLLLCRARYLLPFTGCLPVTELLSSLPVACMKPPLPICHLSFTFIVQHDHFDLLLPTFWLNSVSELHLLLVASDLLDHEFGTLPNYIKLAPSFSSFRSRLKTHLFTFTRQYGHLVNSPRLWFDAILDFCAFILRTRAALDLPASLSLTVAATAERCESGEVQRSARTCLPN